MRTPERVELTDAGPARLVLVKIVLRRADANVLGPGKNGLSAARRKVGRSIGFERSQGRALGQFPAARSKEGSLLGRRIRMFRDQFRGILLSNGGFANLQKYLQILERDRDGLHAQALGLIH